MVVPNSYSFIFTAGHYQLFSYTDIKTCNLIFVENALNVIKSRLKRNTVWIFTIQWTRNHLTLTCDDINGAFFVIKAH